MLEFLHGRAGRVTAQAVVLGAVAGGAAAYLHSGKTVTLTVDGVSRTVDADADTVQALLADEQVPVTTRDIVAPGLTAQLKDGQQVVVRYARPLTVTVDGVRRTYWTTALTVDDALNVLSIRADGARLSASRSMPLGRPIRTWSAPAMPLSGSSSRASARNRLFIRLRMTALPTRRLTVMPTRRWPRSFGATYSTSSGWRARSNVTGPAWLSHRTKTCSGNRLRVGMPLSSWYTFRRSSKLS